MKSTFKVLYFLKRNRLKKNGKMPIMARITIDGKAVEFNTKLELYPELWDVKAGKATGRTKDVLQINMQLDNIKAVIHKHFYHLQETESYVTAELLKNTFFGKTEKENTILEFFTKHNEQYKLKVGVQATYTTYVRYELTKNRLIDFLKNKYSTSDISIKKIDVLFLENFYLYIRQYTSCNNNSAMKFVQRLRTVMYYAKGLGVTFPDPFYSFKIRFEKEERDFLSMEEINKIYNKQFTSKKLEQVKDMFIFSCFTGLSYVDLSNLKKENIQTSFDGNLWIIINRQKTNVRSSIRLLDIPVEIINKYKNQLPENKILPIISNQKMNEYLKEIAVICNIDKKLTFHVARHRILSFGL